MPFTTIKDEDYKYTYHKDKATFLFVAEHIEEKIQGKLVSIDIETYPLNRYFGDKDAGLLCVKSGIRTLQLYDGDSCYVLDFFDETDSNLLTDKFFATKLFTFLQSKKLVAHNALFETQHLQRIAHAHGILKPLNIYCTMNAFRLVVQATQLNPYAYNAGLANVAKMVLGVEVDKKEQTSNWRKSTLTPIQIEYCAKDAILPHLIFHKLAANLAELEMETVFKINTKAQEVVAHMNLHGITIDKAHHEKLMKFWGKEQKKYAEECFLLLNDGKGEIGREKLKELFIDKIVKKYQDPIWSESIFSKTRPRLKDFPTERDKFFQKALNSKDKGYARAYKRFAKNINSYIVDPNSSKQLSDWLKLNVDVTGWPVSEKSGHLVTDSDTFEEHEHLEIVKPLVQFKKYAKLYSTYGEGLKNFFVDHDGRTAIHPNLSLCFTETGRMSSYAPNTQNLVKGDDIRKMFITRGEDYKLLVADFSQIEIRVFAHLSEDPVMLQAYENRVDIHSMTAAALSGKTEKDVGKDAWKQIRFHAKACFSGDTEILTKTGWVKFEDYNGKDLVAQYKLPVGIETDRRPSSSRYTKGLPREKFNGLGGEISFAKPIDFQSFEDTQTYLHDDRNSNICATDNHNILYIDSRGYLCKEELQNVPVVKSSQSFIGAGWYDDKNEILLHPLLTRILAMTVADGNFNGDTGIRFGFSKRRKHRRCEELLTKAGIDYTKSVNKSGVTTIYVANKKLVEKLLQYTDTKKTLTWDCLFTIPRRIYLEELSFWDSHVIQGNTRDRVLFSTTNKQTADVIQAMCTISGIASVCKKVSEKIGNKNICYCVSFAFKEGQTYFTTWNPKEYKKQTVYCVQVPSENIVVRRKGKVSIQGNCNFCMLFGGGAATVQKYANRTYRKEMLHPMTIEQAEDAVATFRETYYTSREWQLEHTSECERTLQVRTPMGKLRRLDPDTYYTVCLNTPVQGGAAEIMLLSMICIYNRILESGIDARIVNVVHDEIIVDCHNDSVVKMKKYIKEGMTEAMLMVFPTATTDGLVDVGVGNNWAEAKL